MKRQGEIFIFDMIVDDYLRIVDPRSLQIRGGPRINSVNQAGKKHHAGLGEPQGEEEGGARLLRLIGENWPTLISESIRTPNSLYSGAFHICMMTDAFPG